MNDGPTEKGSGGEQGGIFGNLPGSRPGTRSPRRAAGRDTKPKRETKRRTESGRKRPPRPRPKPAARPAPRRTEERHRAPQPPQGSAGGGLEDIAWAGVAVAAEAATIGVRLASRAIEALRGSTERD